MSAPVRIDKWLWAARFFKTRSLARAAVKGGKVQMQGVRVKPARNLQAGDQLQIQRGVELHEITVVELSDRRGPASIAQSLYVEDPQSIERRAQAASQRALERAADAGRERRPDKRQRRKLIRFFRDSD